MNNFGELDATLSGVEAHLSGIEAAVDALDESISGVEDELQNHQGGMNQGSEKADCLLSDMHRNFDLQRRLLFLLGMYVTVLIVLVEVL